MIAPCVLSLRAVALACGSARLLPSMSFHGCQRPQRSESLLVLSSLSQVVSHQAYNHKCDVFSYGILLWEMVTGGAVPYAGFTPLQVRSRLCLGPRPPAQISPSFQHQAES